jgi:hypothetical protein
MDAVWRRQMGWLMGRACRVWRAAGLRVWLVRRGMGTVRRWTWGWRGSAQCRVWRFDPAAGWGLRLGKEQAEGSAVAWIGRRRQW